MADFQSELADLIAARLVPLLDQRVDCMMERFDAITNFLSSQEQMIRGLTVCHGGENSMRSTPPSPMMSPTRRCKRAFQKVVDCNHTTGDSAIAHPDQSFLSDLAPTSLQGTLKRISSAMHSWDVDIDDEGNPCILKRTSRVEPVGLCRFVHRLIWHPKFDAFWLGMIALNALFMGAQLQFHAIWGHSHWSNMAGDTLFTAFFSIELLVRLMREGLSEYLCGRQRAWAMLDVFTLLLSFFDASLYIYDAESSATSSLRIFRVFRVLRIAKVLRGIRFMRDLRLLIVGMINSVMSIAWTVLALLFLMYTGAIIVMSVVIDDVLEEAGYYVNCWGGIVTSMCTLFQVMSGDGWWSEVVAGIDSKYPAMRYFFMAYYSITAYGLLNIVTGIFVEQTLSASRTDAELLQDKRLEERNALRSFFQNLFEIMDTNNSGEVDFNEFAACVKETDIRFAMERADLKVDDVLKMFLLLDKRHDGVITREEFVKGCMMLRGQPTTADIVEHSVHIRRMIKCIEDRLHSRRDASKVSI